MTGRDEGGAPADVLVKPDGSGSPVSHAILAAPRLARRADGSPGLSITFMLDEQPSLEAEDLRPYIRLATIGVDLTVAPSPAVLRSLADSPEDAAREFRSLFPRELRFSLQNSRPFVTLAETTVTGGTATAALSATIERAEALQLLDALLGNVCTLNAVAEARHRTSAPPATTVRMTVDLLPLHDALAAAAGAGSVFYEADLRNYLASMIQQGIVRTEGGLTADEASADEIAAASLESFLRAASFVLDRIDDDERVGDLGQRYQLGSAPSGSFEIRFQTRTEALAGEMATVTTEASMQHVLNHVLTGPDADSIIHWVVIDENGRGLIPLARRVRQAPGHGARGARPSSVALAATGNRITTLANAIRPSAISNIATHSLIAAQPSLFQHNALTNLTLSASSGEQVRHLPVVENHRDALWKDRIDAKRYWYAPEFVVVLPAANARPDQSPFRFSFETQGHDLLGQVGLEATIRLTLRQQMPEAARASLERLAGAKADPVVAKNLSVELEVPFRDEDGTTRVERCRASSVDVRGAEIVAEFRFLDKWARIAYGALAYPGFQTQPARVSVGFVFDAYTPMPQNIRYELVHGGKMLEIPIAAPGARDREDRGEQPFVDARDGSIHFPGGQLQFAPPMPARSRASRPAAMLTASTIRPAHAVVASAIIRPPVSVSPALVNALKIKKYVLRNVPYETGADALLRCSDYGGLYVEVKDGEQLPIGCQDAFKLGQTAHLLYERIDIPSSIAGCAVYRSLRTPGRFLVVPETYAITRFEPDDPARAYRPAILLYSTIDVDDLGASRCAIMATLRPDMARFDRTKLLDHLRREHDPEATLEYITELSADVAFDWALPMSGAGGVLRLETEATRTAEGFEVSIATDAIGLPQLNAILASSGITGAVTFTLSNGSELRSRLRLDLAEVVGPWEAGPLEAIVNRGGQASLSNRIESTVNVSELLLLGEDGAVLDSVPAELRIEGGGQATVSLADAPSRIVPKFTVESSAGSLEEIRSFIDDIAVGVTFVSRLDLAAQGFERVRITVRVIGLAGEQVVEFTESSEAVQGVGFLLPLTAYLAGASLELQVTATHAAGEVTRPDPIPWRLSSGSIIHVTAELLGLV